MHASRALTGASFPHSLSPPLPSCSINHLIDVHAVVTRQGASRRQIIGTQESGDDAVLVHLPDGGAVHEINQAVLVHGDAC